MFTLTGVSLLLLLPHYITKAARGSDLKVMFFPVSFSRHDDVSRKEYASF